MGRVESKPANAEKSLLDGKGTRAAHSVAAKVTGGGSFPLLLRSFIVRSFGLLDVRMGTVGFQLVSR